MFARIGALFEAHATAADGDIAFLVGLQRQVFLDLQQRRSTHFALQVAAAAIGSDSAMHVSADGFVRAIFDSHV